MLLTFSLQTLFAVAAASHAAADTTPIDCDHCADWNRPQPPFRIFGNTYYVGVNGVSTVLIDSGHGLVLIDGGLPQSAAKIAANVRALGFKMGNVRWILNSHAHFDHAGGIAALQRMSGARVAASALGREGLIAGRAVHDDPQAGYGDDTRFPAVGRVTAIVDGASVNVGELSITAHATPGHTPGSTTWTWRSCEQRHCVDVVYADSLSAVSSPDFRFSDDAARVTQFRSSIAKVRALPCQIMIAAHPDGGRLFAEHKASAQRGRDAFIDASACRTYADNALAKFDARLAEEAAPPAK